MKWDNFWSSFLGALAALILIIALLALVIIIWWNSPMAEPLHLETHALPPDYTGYWSWFWWLAGAFGLWALAMLGLTIGIFRKVKG